MHYTAQTPLQFQWGSRAQRCAVYVTIFLNFISLDLFYLSLYLKCRWCNGEPNNGGNGSRGPVVEGCAQLVGIMITLARLNFRLCASNKPLV